MSAQPGGSISLAYGPQGTQQPGGALVLAYGGGAPVRRRVVAGIRAPWGQGRAVQVESRSPSVPTHPREVAVRAPWGKGHGVQVERRVPWVTLRKVDDENRSPWGRYTARPALQPRMPWGVARRADEEMRAPWGRYAALPALLPHMPWGLAVAVDLARHVPWGQYAAHPARALQAPWVRVRRVDLERWLPWTRYSRQLSPGWGVVIPENPGGETEPLFVIPILRTYMTVHTIYAELLPGGERVALRDVQIDSADDGFGWTLSASGGMALMEQLAPVGGVPAQIQITLDGIAFVFAIIDPPARTRAFAQRSVQVTGQSVTALLGAKDAPVRSLSNSSARTAQQLMVEALEFTGVDVDWQIPDWLVPAGVWNFQGTPLAAVLRIAEAAGAVVRSHRTLPQLQIASRYPYTPWEWGAAGPDVQMPRRIITTDTLQADYNPPWEAVYVSGEESGFLGHVVRAGSAEVVLAEQVTDALITAPEVARERGRSILGAAGKRMSQPMTVPLLTGGTNPGLILPGYLLEVTEPDTPWRGLVRSLSISAGMPTVRQSITVERNAS